MVFGAMCQVPTPVVSAPILEGFAAKQEAWEVSDRLRKSLETTVTGMQSVQQFVSRANQVSCTIDIFNNSIALSQQHGFYNCQLENKANGIGNDLMMVMDVANAAMSSVFISEPQERLASIDRAIDKYVDIDSDMWEVINWIYFEVRKRQKEKEEYHEVERLSHIPLVPAEISGRSIIIPQGQSDPTTSSNGNEVVFRSSGNGGIDIPNTFSFDEGFSNSYRLLNIILLVAFGAGLITVVWAYVSGSPKANTFLIAYIVAMVVGNILKAMFFI